MKNNLKSQPPTQNKARPRPSLPRSVPECARPRAQQRNQSASFRIPKAAHFETAVNPVQFSNTTLSPILNSKPIKNQGKQSRTHRHTVEIWGLSQDPIGYWLLPIDYQHHPLMLRTQDLQPHAVTGQKPSGNQVKNPQFPSGTNPNQARNNSVHRCNHVTIQRCNAQLIQPLAPTKLSLVAS